MVVMRIPPRPLIFVVVVALVAAACGDDAADLATATTSSDAPVTTVDPSTTPAPTTTAPPSTAPPSTTTTTTTSSSSSSSPGTVPPWFPAPSDTVPEADLPGDFFEFGYPLGSLMSVFGVRFDDVLNARSIPGLDGDIVFTLDPLERGPLTTGRQRVLPTTLWVEIVFETGQVAWVNRSFVAVEGITETNDAWIADQVGALSAPDGEALAAALVELVLGDDVEPVPRVVVSSEPLVAGGEGTVTIDVVGLGDDSVLGYRLVIQADVDADGWHFASADRIVMCARGGELGGPCV